MVMSENPGHFHDEEGFNEPGGLPLFCLRVAGERLYHPALSVHHKIELEGEPRKASCVGDLLPEWVPVHYIYRGILVAHEGEVVLRDRAVRRYPGHDDFVAPAESRRGMGHAFPHADNEVSGGDGFVYFDDAPSVGLPYDDVFRGPAIVGGDPAPETGKDLVSDFGPQLFFRRSGVSARGADAAHALVRDPCLVKPVHYLGKGKVGRGGPLLVVEDEDRFHTRFCEFLYAGRSYGIIQGTFHFGPDVREGRRRGPVLTR